MGKLDNNNLLFIIVKNFGFLKNYLNGIVVCRIEYCLMMLFWIYLDVNIEILKYVWNNLKYIIVLFISFVKIEKYEILVDNYKSLLVM